MSTQYKELTRLQLRLAEIDIELQPRWGIQDEVSEAVRIALLQKERADVQQNIYLTVKRLERE
jgi:hypothetical protein